MLARSVSSRPFLLPSPSLDATESDFHLFWPDTSNAPTTFLIRRVAKLAGVPLQEFEVRNDSACGSTIGPHLSVTVRTVDVGLAQLSMHSIRETAAVKDVPY